MQQIFSEFALLLMISAIAGAVAIWLRQPVLIAYIVVGIVVGPAVLGIVQVHEHIELLAQVGVTVLLFVVGLKLDLQHVRHIGPVALATGLGQLAFTTLFGFLLVLALGKTPMEALYVAVALTFSSTIIIVKLLTDKREIDALHGRIAVGFLIVQDLAVVIAMMTMSALRGAGDHEPVAILANLGLRIVTAALAMVVLMRYVLPWLIHLMARSQELLLIFAVAWGTSLAAAAEAVGMSKEVGAFLAGFSLASTQYRDAINARLTGIRDFLLLFFFIGLGAQLEFSSLEGEFWPAMILSLFVLIGNPLIVIMIMSSMGYRLRTGFLAGLTVAQISEFSIIFVAMGISLGHVGIDALSLTTLVGIVTIALSTYLILYSHPLYDRLAPLLQIFERRTPFREMDPESERSPDELPDVLVVGLGRYGSRLALKLQRTGLKVLSIDFDPEAVAAARRKGVHARYGDGMETALIESLPLSRVSWVVSTVPDLPSNRGLMHALREADYTGSIAVVAREDVSGVQLRKLGAVVLYPMRNAVDFVVNALTDLIHAKDKPQ